MKEAANWGGSFLKMPRISGRDDHHRANSGDRKIHNSPLGLIALAHSGQSLFYQSHKP
jgi:hypothetical protein